MMNSINYEWIERIKYKLVTMMMRLPYIDVTIDEDSMIFDNQIVTINLTKSHKINRLQRQPHRIINLPNILPFNEIALRMHNNGNNSN